MKHFCRLIVTAIAAIMMLPTISAQNKPVNIDVKDMQLSEILKVISAQSDYRFVYSNSAIGADRKITVKLSGTDISKVMDRLLSGTGIAYTILDRQIALSPAAPPQEHIRTKVQDHPRQGNRQQRRSSAGC